MNAIMECVQAAIKTPEEEILQAVTKTKVIQTKVMRLTEKKLQLLGFEEASNRVIAGKIQKLEEQKARLDSLINGGSYPRLSFDALKWRDENGYPKVVLFDLFSPRASFDVVAIRRAWEKLDFHELEDFEQRTTPDLPTPILACYKDVFRKLLSIATKQAVSVHLTHDCDGVLPNPTREKIKKAQQTFPAVFILAEAVNWQLTTRAPSVEKPARPDPLILGWDNHHLWIIDHFDLTPVEKYIKDEFAT